MERPVLTEDGSERRGWPRAPIRRTTRIVLRSGAKFEARSFDISSSGLGVLCDQAIPKGELCAVGLTMLFADDSTFDVKVAAHVAYSVFSSDRQAFKIGLSFNQPAPALLQAIERYVGETTQVFRDS